MTGFRERFSSVEGPLEHAEVVLAEVQRGLAAAQAAEAVVARTGTILAWIAAVALGGACLIGLAAFFSFRWLSRIADEASPTAT